jgi:hypothetical protein
MSGKNKKNRALTGIFLASLLTLSGGFTEQVLAQKQSREGFPGRRIGGGSRGGCPFGAKRLTALVPENNLGLTVAASPTFFFYIPQTPTPQTVEFVLLDDNDRQVYKTAFMTTGASETIHLSLPASKALPPLAIGKNYHWYFSMLCNPANRAYDVFVEGWIKRVEPNPLLAIKLEKASLQQRAALYASAGLWHEALVTLAQLRRDRPNDSAIAANWTKLLQFVGLDTIAQEPFSPSPIPPLSPSSLQPVTQ